MRHVICDVCGADEPRLFAARSPRPDVLHARFVRCGRCGFVYADPRADAWEAAAFYERVSERGSGSLQTAVDSEQWRVAVAGRRRHLDAAAAAVEGDATRFLDVGFGDASSLAAAAELGWEPHGLEYAGWLVEAARARLGLEHVGQGGLEDASYPDGFFDVVYAWHVIEHVLDVREWLDEVARIVRPGGVVVIGTENAGALQARLWNGLFRLARRTPMPPTSTDHTYWFSPTALGALLGDAGLDAVELRAYENSPLEILRSQTRERLRNPRWLATLSLYLVGAAAAQVRPAYGGKLLAIARRDVSRRRDARRPPAAS